MSDNPNPSDELAQLRAQQASMQIEMARYQVYADHPQLRDLHLLDDFQGSPDQIRAFGAKLAERFPPPAPTPAPLTQQPAAPPVPAQQAPPQQQTPATTPTAPAPAVVPETSAVPTPSPQDILTQQTADASRADDIRERMTQNLATRAEVLWLSQYAPRREADLGNGHRGMTGGFVSAVKQFQADRAAVLGRTG